MNGEGAGDSIPAERSGAGWVVAVRLVLGRSGGGFQGDAATESLELANVVALLTLWVDTGVIECTSALVQAVCSRLSVVLSGRRATLTAGRHSVLMEPRRDVGKCRELDTVRRGAAESGTLAAFYIRRARIVA